MKVAMLGAAGGIGQPMSLLMKLNPFISHLALYDIVHTPGVAADVSHCSTPAQVSGHLGPQQLKDALEGSQVVVIPAGVPRKPGPFINTNSFSTSYKARMEVLNCNMCLFMCVCIYTL